MLPIQLNGICPSSSNIPKENGPKLTIDSTSLQTKGVHMRVLVCCVPFHPDLIDQSIDSIFNTGLGCNDNILSTTTKRHTINFKRMIVVQGRILPSLPLFVSNSFWIISLFLWDSINSFLASSNFGSRVKFCSAILLLWAIVISRMDWILLTWKTVHPVAAIKMSMISGKSAKTLHKTLRIHRNQVFWNSRLNQWLPTLLNPSSHEANYFGLRSISLI